MRIVARDDVFHSRRMIEHAHEWRAGIKAAQCGHYVSAVARRAQLALHSDMNAARKRAGVRHEGNVSLGPAGTLDTGRNLRSVTMCQGVIRIQITVAQRMMRACRRLSSR